MYFGEALHVCTYCMYVSIRVVHTNAAYVHDIQLLKSGKQCTVPNVCAVCMLNDCRCFVCLLLTIVDTILVCYFPCSPNYLHFHAQQCS